MRVWVILAACSSCGRLAFGELAAGDALANDVSDAIAGPDPDLIVHATFDGDPIVDVSGLLATPTCAATQCPTIVPGRIGNALQFDGVDDYLMFTSPSELDFGSIGQPFSVAVWYRASDLTPPIQRVIMAQAVTGGSVSYQLGFEPWQGGSALDLVWKVCATDCQSGMFAVASDLAALDRWTLIVGTWDGADTRLYVDAQLVATVPKPMINYDGFPLMVGADYESGGSIEDTFDGLIDDLRIYRRALSNEDQLLLLAAP